MNVENTCKLIEHLKTLRPEEFNMAHWYSCLAGHAAILHKGAEMKFEHPEVIAQAALEFLGLDPCLNSYLFACFWSQKRFKDIKATDAIQQLESMLPREGPCTSSV